MPSLGEIANEMKALLVKVDSNTKATKNNTNSIKNQMTTLISTNTAGFLNLSQGMQVQILQQQQTNQILVFQAKQNQTIICWLTNIADVLCSILRNLEMQTKTQKEIADTLVHLNQIIELVHSRETIEVNRLEEINANLDICCPEEEVDPKPCFTECRDLEAPKFDKIDSKWKPLTTDKII